MHFEVITRCCCSIETATVWRPSSVLATQRGGWEERRRSSGSRSLVFRADAAFAKPEIYEALEEREVKYIRANDSLQRDIELTRPVGRPSKKPLVEFKPRPV